MQTKRKIEYNKEFRKTHKKEAREYYLKNLYKQKQYHLQARFKLTLSEYNTLLIKQKGVCAICFKPETAKSNKGKVKKLAVDHNHETGENRGLLCSNCNRALGMFYDSALILESAKQYRLKWI